ncbi:MAG: type II toxin-antitoxin system RelE/ParE family toxin [Candidatus Paracaedimonas acanthamoebae]|jgi:mRNA interferase RelE/StbE|uniref:Type II toxin-antitoxin system RelE/ParE family toxin n=1 Tax=Candidatus Paracaedimonas acanthamoebae TaxID=244581 RepID=A0A8J7PSU0_9PROT|nr:type II toxin-antitoxin system RelE/ParE family toxin [Candidatus Paracaedimonas acanthamoebae]
MPYKLTFLESAKKEWDKLSPDLQQFFKAKLSKILEQPHIPKNKLINMEGCYKIKLRSAGYRLVYRVYDDRVVVQVIAVGKRDKNLIYRIAASRL